MTTARGFGGTTHGRLFLALAVAALGALTGCDGQLEPAPGRFERAAPARPAEVAPGWIAAAAAAPSADAQAASGPVYAAGEAQPDPQAYSHSYAPPPAPAAPAAAPATAAASADQGENTARTPPAGSTLRPNIANVSPSRGAPGMQLTITGSDFSNVQVMVGGSVAQVTSQSSNAVTVIAPDGTSGAAAIVVTNRDGTYSVAGNAYQFI